MRVYFVGGHRAGKTLLVEKIAHKYKLKQLSEVARTALARTNKTFDQIRLDVELVSKYQHRVYEEQLQVEREAGDDFVSDRAFDNLAYAAEHAENVLATITESHDFQEYIRWIRAGFVFFVRPLPHAVGDGVVPISDLDMVSVHRIDGMVKFMLELWRIPYVPIETESPKDRWTTVCRFLDLAIRPESSRA